MLSPLWFCLPKSLPGYDFFSKKHPRTSQFKLKHNGLHELESIEGCPEDGRGGSRERGYGFGDVREEKSGEHVATKAEDKLKL